MNTNISSNIVDKVSNIPVAKRSLRKRLGSLVPRARLSPNLLSYVLLSRVPFALWVHLRRFKYVAWYGIFPKNHPALKGSLDGVSEHDKARTIPHNAAQIGAITRYRTERMINVLRSIESLDRKKAKLLCVGPRNEAELLLFKLYGFNLSNITAIDLFTYSPLIDVMDMHQMKYPDHSFDVLYSSYVLRYSPDLKKACDESIRVLKNGGLMVAGFVTGGSVTYNITGSELKGGVKELLAQFGDHVDHVFWQEEHLNEDQSRTCTVIFRLKK